jgi:hypothetical protein
MFGLGCKTNTDLIGNRRVSTSHDPAIKLPASGTFAWHNSELCIAQETKMPSKDIAKEIRRALQTALKEKGFTIGPHADADILVTYILVVDSKLTQGALNESYGITPRPELARGMPDELGPGTLILDIRVAKTGKLAWRGTIETRVLENLTLDERRSRVEQVARSLLADFPK